MSPAPHTARAQGQVTLMAITSAIAPGLGCGAVVGWLIWPLPNVFSYEIAPRIVTWTSGLFRILTPAKSEQLRASTLEDPMTIDL
jgi:hypothetical protein